MSSSVFALQVSPSIPSPLERLDDLAKNFWFSWNPALGQLFRRLDPKLWRRVEGSPRLFLRCVDQSVLDHAAGDAAFIAEFRTILAPFDARTSQQSDGQRRMSKAISSRISARVRLQESFHLLGRPRVLAGDTADRQRPESDVRRGRAALSPR